MTTDRKAILEQLDESENSLFPEYKSAFEKIKWELKEAKLDPDQKPFCTHLKAQQNITLAVANLKSNEIISAVANVADAYASLQNWEAECKWRLKGVDLGSAVATKSLAYFYIDTNKMRNLRLAMQYFKASYNLFLSSLTQEEILIQIKKIAQNVEKQDSADNFWGRLDACHFLYLRYVESGEYQKEVEILKLVRRHFENLKYSDSDSEGRYPDYIKFFGSAVEKENSHLNPLLLGFVYYVYYQFAKQRGYDHLILRSKEWARTYYFKALSSSDNLSLLCLENSFEDGWLLSSESSFAHPIILFYRRARIGAVNQDTFVNYFKLLVLTSRPDLIPSAECPPPFVTKLNTLALNFFIHLKDKKNELGKAAQWIVHLHGSTFFKEFNKRLPTTLPSADSIISSLLINQDIPSEEFECFKRLFVFSVKGNLLYNEIDEAFNAAEQSTKSYIARHYDESKEKEVKDEVPRHIIIFDLKQTLGKKAKALKNTEPFSYFDYHSHKIFVYHLADSIETEYSILKKTFSAYPNVVSAFSSLYYGFKVAYSKFDPQLARNQFYEAARNTKVAEHAALFYFFAVHASTMIASPSREDIKLALEAASKIKMPAEKIGIVAAATTKIAKLIVNTDTELNSRLQDLHAQFKVKESKEPMVTPEAAVAAVVTGSLPTKITIAPSTSSSSSSTSTTGQEQKKITPILFKLPGASTNQAISSTSLVQNMMIPLPSIPKEPSAPLQEPQKAKEPSILPSPPPAEAVHPTVPSSSKSPSSVLTSLSSQSLPYVRAASNFSSVGFHQLVIKFLIDKNIESFQSLSQIAFTSGDNILLKHLNNKFIERIEELSLPTWVSNTEVDLINKMIHEGGRVSVQQLVERYFSGGEYTQLIYFHLIELAFVKRNLYAFAGLNQIAGQQGNMDLLVFLNEQLLHKNQSVLSMNPRIFSGSTTPVSVLTSMMVAPPAYNS